MAPPFHILLVEDSPADARLIERALREADFPHRLSVARDGAAALAELADPAAGPPDLVLLDLNLPGLDGLQVLARIKGDPDLRIIPVVVLSTSRHDDDVLRAYHAGANTYIQKPAEYARYRDLVAVLRAYWTGTAVLPPRA